jgi:hypothetical protein
VSQLFKISLQHSLGDLLSDAISPPTAGSTTSSASKSHTRQDSNSSSGPNQKSQKQTSQNPHESTATAISKVIYNHIYQIDISTYSELAFINYNTASETGRKNKTTQQSDQIDLNHNIPHITISGSHYITASGEGKAREGEDYFNNVIAWQTWPL